MIKLFELFNQLGIFKGLFYLIGLVTVYQVINRNIENAGQTLQDIGRGLNVLALVGSVPISVSAAITQRAYEQGAILV